jgi:hypothetical protein
MSLTLFVSACQKQKTISHIIKNQYSIEVPDFMKKTTALNQGASLQLHNETKEFFTVVIDEPQDEFNEMMMVLENQYDASITGYSNLISDNLKLMVEENKFSELKEIEIDSKKAKLFTIEGKVDEHDVVYHLGFIEGKKHYYQIVSWTSSKQKEANLKNMENIVLSFKELEQ